MKKPPTHVLDYHTEPTRVSQRLWRSALIGFGVGVAISLVLDAALMELRPGTEAERWASTVFFTLNHPWLWLWNHVFPYYGGKEHDLGGFFAFMGLCWGLFGAVGAAALSWMRCRLHARKRRR